MTARATEAAAVAASASLLTLVIAAPVLRSPSERLFGMEIVGRHYDPFTVMEQFIGPIRWTAFLQPVSDLPGHVLAAWVGPVASYNVLVLLSFPLVAAAVYLLARHCTIAPAAAAGAAFAAAFSPFHFAQAAYHLHVAQLQWMPLYLLALWRCLDRPSWSRAIILTLAIAAVLLSNFYGGLIAAVITPVAVAAYWWVHMRHSPSPLRRAGITVMVLAVAAAAGAAYTLAAAANQTAVDFTPGDVLRYRAVWWRYVAPPVAHPWLGDVLRGGDPGLLEQQLSIGWSVLVLSVVAVAGWLRHRGTAAELSHVPLFAAIALVAFGCSISATTMLAGPLPMFRAYARFGGVVQLMMALLAAVGAQWMWRSRRAAARGAVLVLVVLTVFEYAVLPSAMWRDVLPTAAHRWATRQGASVHVFDCYPYSRESQSVQWLTAGRVILRERSVGDCREPGVIAMLADTGFTHMLVRHNTAEGKWFDGRPTPAGLQLAARFDDAEVLAVIESPSLIRTTDVYAFYPAEFDDTWSWRWMGAQASWTVANSSARTLLASVDVDMNAFHQTRRLTVVLDGTTVQDIIIEPHRSVQRIGPLVIRPGDHALVFRADQSPVAADEVMHNGDPRPLSVAFGDWRWSIGGSQP